MIHEVDLRIPMDDGVGLAADIFRPDAQGSYPVILSHGPYGKSLHFEDGAPYPWRRLMEDAPESLRQTSNRYQSWEVVDPERWVPHGYVVVRVDSRGAGRSPGYLNPLSARETRDMYDCIEWAASQPWANGKVGLSGISYYAINQWMVASLQPPHLAALCVWEGASDQYRDMFYHGGILSEFSRVWYPGRILTRQHGVGSRGYRSRFDGKAVAGVNDLPAEVLEANRTDLWRDALSHPLVDSYWHERIPELERIEVPLLSAGNLGGMGLHLRGNVEGFVRAASSEKWLELHTGPHWHSFYSNDGFELQRRFFDRFLRGDEASWTDQARVQIQVRHASGRTEVRESADWPIPGTQFTLFHLDGEALSLQNEPPVDDTEVSFDALGDGVTFLSKPLDEDLELTGPIWARLYVSSSTADADLFLVLRAFRQDMKELTFHGSNDPHTPISHGWLRASHRQLDDVRSSAHRPFHPHLERAELQPGETYELDIELWPTSVVLPAGYRLALSVRGRDYVYPGVDVVPLPQGGQESTSSGGFSGVGPFRHAAAESRPVDVFGGVTTLRIFSSQPSFVELPIVPRSDPPRARAPHHKPQKGGRNQ